MSDAMRLLAALERMNRACDWLNNAVGAGDEGAAEPLADAEAAIAQLRSVIPAKVRASVQEELLAEVEMLTAMVLSRDTSDQALLAQADLVRASMFSDPRS